jgi:hypothetical protein
MYVSFRYLHPMTGMFHTFSIFLTEPGNFCDVLSEQPEETYPLSSMYSYADYIIISGA